MNKFYCGNRIWPSQEVADKSGEVEQGLIVTTKKVKDEWVYIVMYPDGFVAEIPESKLSINKPLCQNPNDLLKKIL